MFHFMIMRGGKIHTLGMCDGRAFRGGGTCEGHSCCCDGGWGTKLCCNGQRQSHSHTPGHQCPCHICKHVKVLNIRKERVSS